MSKKTPKSDARSAAQQAKPLKRRTAKKPAVKIVKVTKAAKAKQPEAIEAEAAPAAQPTVNRPKPQQHGNRWSLVCRRVAHIVMHSSVLEAMLIATLLLARYLINSDFSYPTEIILPIVLFAVLGAGVFYFYKLILKETWVAHAAALPVVYGLYGYSYAYPRFRHWADALLPDRFATPFTTSVARVLLLVIIFGLLAYAAGKVVRRIKPLRELPLLKIATFALCFIFVIQVVKVGGRLLTIRHQLNYHANNQPLQPPKGAAAASKPDIYYFVFDRYASSETLASIYNYDNSDMLHFLDGQGFTTRKQAYSNYPFTPQSVSSTLQMSYHTALGQQFSPDARGFQTAFPYRAILNDSLVAETLKNNGYTYNQVSSWWDFTRNNPTADSEPSRSFRLRTFGLTFWQTDLQRDIINKSILSPWLLKGATVGRTALLKYDRDYNPAENFATQMTALTAIVDAAAVQKTPQFTFGHILSPHDPYVFNADGSPTTFSQDRNDKGADETVKYANQLTYVNTQYKKMLSYVRSKDPSAVIIVQADEGPYPKQFRGALTPTHYYDPKGLPLPQMRQKFGIIASYYLPGEGGRAAAESIDSSVNAFRVVFNQYFGYALPLLPDCQFTAGNKFYMYDYRLVSGKLKNMDDPDVCKHV